MPSAARSTFLYRIAGVLGLVLGAVAAPHPAAAQTNLVTNGSFAITGGSTSFQFGTYGGYNSAPLALPGWSSPNGYNYVFLPTSTSATGYYGNLSLWSPASATPAANGFTNASATGGNFIAADSAYGTEAITQTINGLVVGATYAVSFAWAGAQQYNYNGATTDTWSVTFGTTTQSTPVVSVASHGFSGWMNATFNYVATSTSQVLSFLAAGTPSGVPPFALLANVSVTQVPEPPAAPIMIGAMAGLLGLAWRRRSPARAARPIR